MPQNGVKTRLRNTLERIKKKIGKPRHLNVLLLGTEQSGKSSLCKRLVLADDVKQKFRPKVEPTVGFVVESVTLFDHVFSIYDMSGKTNAIKIWEIFYSQTQTVIFVFDCSNLSNLRYAKEMLFSIVDHEGYCFEYINRVSQNPGKL